MFSSNQIFDIVCEFQNLSEVISLGVRLSEKEWCMTERRPKCRPAFKIALERYCFGVGSIPEEESEEECDASTTDDWTDYPFDYDPVIIAQIITQWVQQQAVPPHSGTDGLEELGVQVRCAAALYRDPETQGQIDEDILDPWDCILVFEPYMQTFEK